MDKVLIIDADKSFRKKIIHSIKLTDCLVIEAAEIAGALEVINMEKPGIIISESGPGSALWPELLENARRANQCCKVLVTIAQSDDIRAIINAMQSGAFDCIDKKSEFNRLICLIERIFETSRSVDQSASMLVPEDNYKDEKLLIGSSPASKEIYRKIGNVTSSRITVMVQGESGTGKELVARTIHNSGITKGKPFVALNCAVLSENLLESELFGHVKGAFTGAIRDKKGKFELAADGTIFLDEISELPANLQVKLLRVIQEREFEKVGGESTLPMRARIIAASNKDLKRLVEQNLFREDLYYRLQVFLIEIPPLRERRDDIMKLVIYFLNKINRELNKQVKKIPYEVMDLLQNNPWKGNVRELQNVLTQAVVLAKGDVLEKENLLLPAARMEIRKAGGSEMSLVEAERKHIMHVLGMANWNKQKASRILKISKATLYSKLRNYRMEELEKEINDISE